jgi:hypothetical protein
MLPETTGEKTVVNRTSAAAQYPCELTIRPLIAAIVRILARFAPTPALQQHVNRI